MIASRWCPEFRRLYGDVWPETYAAIDIETTGFSREKDLVLEFGHCLVRGREPADRGSLVLDWSDHPVVPDWWVRERLDKLARRMQQDGRPWRLTYDYMRAEGVRADRALPYVLEFLEALRGSGTLLVGHNAYSFDEEMLAANFEGFLGVDGFRFGENELFDTGAVEKASQCPDDPEMLPRPGDTLESYFRRVVNRRVAGVKWSLDRHCLPKYGLAEKHGLDPSDCHSAGFDAYLTHLLMEEYRARVEADGYFSPEALAAAHARMCAEARASRADDAADRRGPPADAQRPAPRRFRGQRNN